MRLKRIDLNIVPSCEYGTNLKDYICSLQKMLLDVPEEYQDCVVIESEVEES